MTSVEEADTSHTDGICQVCTASWQDAYADILSDEYIEANTRLRYRPDLVAGQIDGTGDIDGIDSWLVALEDTEGASSGDDPQRNSGETTAGVVAAVRDDRPEPGVGEISNLYVHPEWQGEGLGSRLLSALTDRQRDAGATEQHTYVFEENEPAIGFYESRGFVATERFPAAAVDGVEPGTDAVQFTRSL